MVLIRTAVRFSRNYFMKHCSEILTSDMDAWSLYDISQFAPSSPEVRCRHFHTSHHQNLIKSDRNRCDVTDVYAEQTDGKVEFRAKHTGKKGRRQTLPSIEAARTGNAE